MSPAEQIQQWELIIQQNQAMIYTAQQAIKKLQDDNQKGAVSTAGPNPFAIRALAKRNQRLLKKQGI